jgi:hypothetical protein
MTKRFRIRGMHTKKLVYRFRGDESWMPVPSVERGLEIMAEEMGPRYDLVGVVDMSPEELKEYAANLKWSSTTGYLGPYDDPNGNKRFWPKPRNG